NGFSSRCQMHPNDGRKQVCSMIFRAGFSGNSAEVKKGESSVRIFFRNHLVVHHQCISNAVAKQVAIAFTYTTQVPQRA
ncbi:MAG: hypothetical protein R8M45_06265, partial [Ghiorsea sp.]